MQKEVNTSMRKYITNAWMVPGFLLLVTQSVMGSLMRIEVEGIVDSIYTGGALALDGSIQIGSTMKGYALYDSEASDRNNYGHTGDYPVSLIWMEIGSYVFYDGPMAIDSGFYVVTDYPEPGVRYNVCSFQGKFDGIVYLNGVEKRYEDLIWEYVSPASGNLSLMYLSNGTLVADDSLPQSMPDISAFRSNRPFHAGIDCVGPGDSDRGTFQIFGQITSVRIIPEPTTVCLLGIGVMMLLRRRWRFVG